MRKVLVLATLVTSFLGVGLQPASAAVTGPGWSWTQTNSNAGGGSTNFGWSTAMNCAPVAGDWTGIGSDRVGLGCYSSSGGWAWQQDTGSGAGGAHVFGWGGSNYAPNCTPIAGDWTGVGNDHVGLACYSSTSGWTWHEDTGSGAGGDSQFRWGGADFTAANCTPITGDWTGVGSDYVGLACYSSTDGWTWNEATGPSGGSDTQFRWGGSNSSIPNCSPITGNWANYTHGTIHVGLACRSSTGWTWNENPGTGGGGATQFGWGGSTATRPTVIPLTGDWNGDGNTTVSLTDSGGRQLTTTGAGTPPNSTLQVVIPVNANVPVAIQGVTIIAPTPAVAVGLRAGLARLGTPYVWGGGTNDGDKDQGCARGGGAYNSCQGIVGFDCSGLTGYVLKQAGFTIPTNSSGQRGSGVEVTWAQSVPGDIIGYPEHVTINLGTINGVRYQLEAPDIGSNVRIKDIFRTDYDGVMYRYWS